MLEFAEGSAPRRLVEHWNDTARDYPRQANLAELFTHSRARRPNACAVLDGDRQLSYAELDQRANQVAHDLLSRGIEPGQCVGVLGQRCAWAVVAILGILKAGAVFVPLDTSYPAPRLEIMAREADVRLLIELPGTADQLGDTMELGRLAQVMRLDDRATEHEPTPTRTVTGDDLAYIVFTSGSTGTPKAVGVRQRSVSRLVLNTDYIELAPGDRMLHTSSLSFDASTFEIWGALLTGGCLVVADTGVLFSPTHLRDVFKRQSITTAFLTTSVFHELARRQPDVLHGVTNVLVGGERLSIELARTVLAHRPPRRLVHVYGPTENTTFTTSYLMNELPADATTVPVGRPIANTTAYVVREDGTVAGVGEPGELVVGGAGVAAGYVNDPALASRRFIPDPFADDPGARLYRTGDVVRWRDDGTIEFIGRRDGQFKLRGHRIEPGEIETVLRRHPAVDDAVAVRVEETEGEPQIVAYVTLAANRPAPGPAELRRYMSEVLPGYMVPAMFVPIERMPLTPSGKIDRAALVDTQPVTSGNARLLTSSPSSMLADRIAAVWREVLGSRHTDRIDPEDTLFGLGGTSFDVPKVHELVSDIVDVPELTPLDLFMYPTLQGYTDHIVKLSGSLTEREIPGTETEGSVTA